MQKLLISIICMSLKNMWVQGQYTWHMLLVSEQTAIYAIQASQHLLQFQLNTYTEDVQ